MQDFRKLRVWQVAHELALEVATALSPGASRRLPGLRSQAVRAAMSVGSNIAEGCGKRTPEEFHRFLEMALASLLELESQLLLARDANVISAGTFLRLDQRSELLRRMLISLMQRVLWTIPAPAVDGSRIVPVLNAVDAIAVDPERSSTERNGATDSERS